MISPYSKEVRGDGPVVNRNLEPFKRISKTANRTLTCFTNEMSEILRDSIVKLDDISMRVRGYVMDKMTILPIDPVASVSRHEIEVVKKKERPKSRKAPSTRSEISPSKKHSTVSLFTTSSRKVNRDSTPIMSLKHEVSVMQQIKLQHKNLTKKNSQQLQQQQPQQSLKLRKLDPIDSTLKLLREKYTERPKVRRVVKKPNRSMDNLQRTVRGRKSQNINKCYVNELFDDHLWFGPKLSTNLHRVDSKVSQYKKTHQEVKNTKLARKYASENFHDVSTRERKCPSDIGFAGKALKIVPDKNDWCVIMHTHKPSPKYELKQNAALAANNILDDITLKDLEPLRAEYPRRDNMLTPDMISGHDTLLYKLISDNQRSLEYLIDIKSCCDLDQPHQQKKKLKRKAKALLPNNTWNSIVTIPEEEVTDQKKEEPKIPSPKHQLEKILVERMSVNNNEKKTLSYHDYHMYKKMVKREQKRRLKKYLVDPTKIPEKKYIVMPVLVKFDKDISPHLPACKLNDAIGSGDRERIKPAIVINAESPRTVLHPYIYMDDAKKETEQPATTVMTVTLTNKPRRFSAEPKNNLKVGRNSPTKISPTRISPKRTFKEEVRVSSSEHSSSGASTTSTQPKSAKGKSKLRQSEVKSAIEDIEVKLRHAATHPDKEIVLSDIEREMEGILSNLKINSDSSSSEYLKVPPAYEPVTIKTEELIKPSRPTSTTQKRPTPKENIFSNTPRIRKKSYDCFKQDQSTKVQVIMPERIRKKNEEERKQTPPGPVEEVTDIWKELEDPKFDNIPTKLVREEETVTEESNPIVFKSVEEDIPSPIVVVEHIEEETPVEILETANLKACLSEETKKFCEQVKEAIQEVQVDVEVPKPMNSSYAWESSERPKGPTLDEPFVTPFMQVVQQYRKNDNSNSFLDYLNNIKFKFKEAEMLRTASHVALVKHLVEEVCVSKNMAHAIYGEYFTSQPDIYEELVLEDAEPVVVKPKAPKTKEPKFKKSYKEGVLNSLRATKEVLIDIGVIKSKKALSRKTEVRQRRHYDLESELTQYLLDINQNTPIMITPDPVKSKKSTRKYGLSKPRSVSLNRTQEVTTIASARSKTPIKDSLDLSSTSEDDWGLIKGKQFLEKERSKTPVRQYSICSSPDESKQKEFIKIVKDEEKLTENESIEKINQTKKVERAKAIIEKAKLINNELKTKTVETNTSEQSETTIPSTKSASTKISNNLDEIFEDAKISFDPIIVETISEPLIEYETEVVQQMCFRRSYGRLLFCFYGLVFVALFCSLNMRFGCNAH